MRPIAEEITMETDDLYNKECKISHAGESAVVRIKKFWDHAYFKKSHYHYIGTNVTLDGGERLSAEYYLYGDKSWRFRMGPSADGSYLDRREDERKFCPRFSLINPFLELLPQIMKIVDDGFDCKRAAVHIDQQPPPGYEPGTLWLRGYFKDKKWLMGKFGQFTPCPEIE
ncbi:hypothetical protein FOZ63_027075 [Perkinsus olseni]|uniref:Uncharacterized protein n=1 Tax=Perkinsus olseni TaxID=32597 RepID=A0A7J6PSR2_PEROL|nr:hypothetical protein FOZ60_006526 [Perkinsus olseni]KAF4698621.1 hypothetical protein FOZ63_027075 [Perkinsus olseni]KAF4724182.1 hypothetical protein FOZ62_001833 [Perkinsus olseni]